MILDAQLLNHVVDAALVGIMAAFSFLTKSFFARIHADLRSLRASVDNLTGRFDSIREDTHRTTTALAVTRQEVSAIWRHLDNTHRRVSDVNLNGED